MKFRSKLLASVILASVATASVAPYSIKSEMVTVEASEAYILSGNTSRFGTAEDARLGKNSLGTYAAGTYYVYKNYNGMVNISKTPNEPGSWINPGSYAKEEVETTVKEEVETTKATTKAEPITTTVKATVAATKPVTTTTATKATTTVTKPATTATTSTVAVNGSYTLNNSVSRYTTANGAENGTGSIGTYAAGQYYIYKIYNGMYNLTKTPGIPGSWVNPTGNKTATAITKPVTTTTATKAATTTTTKATTAATSTTVKVGGDYVVSTSMKGYGTAYNAKTATGSYSNIVAGKYFVYKISDGMVNISKTPGIPGSWINPGVAITTVAPTTSQTSAIKSTIPTYKSIVDLALTKLGADGKEFYTWYGLNYRDEWCAMFVSWLAAKTGQTNLIPKYSYVDDFVDWYKSKKFITAPSTFRPQKDMLIVFDWNNNGYGDHIGVVTGSDSNYVYTVEGNYNDRVQKGKYSINDSDILGYALPAYPGAAIGDTLVNAGAWIKRLVR